MTQSNYNILKKLLVVVLSSFCLPAQAWQPKEKTINVVIPFTPGSGNEMSFRAVAAVVEQEKGVIFNIHHRPGADGNIGMNHFAEQPANGQWIAVPSCQSTFVAAELHWSETIKYKPMEFTLVTNIGKSPLAIIAHVSSDIRTPQDLITAVRANKRNISIGVGSSAHKLAYEYLKASIKTQTNLTAAIDYRGPAPVAQDVAGGHVELGILPIAVAQTLLPTGKIRIIGIAGEKKFSAMPTVPLMKDHVPDFNVYACWNIVLPKNTDPAIQQWFVDAFTLALQNEKVRQFFDTNLMFSNDTKDLGPASLHREMTALRKQWNGFTAAMPAPMAAAARTK